MTPKKQSKDSGGRGSAEAIEKRRTARQLNTLIMAGGSDGRPLDGRTAKRRERLIRELKDGRRGKPLKPSEAVSHVNELMEIGETLASLAKIGVKPRRITVTAELQDVIERTQRAYGYHKQAWKILGVNVPETRGKRSRG
jgi:hypothetical protein